MTRRPQITSSANDRLKAVRRLARRRSPSVFLVEGHRQVASRPRGTDRPGRRLRRTRASSSAIQDHELVAAGRGARHPCRRARRERVPVGLGGVAARRAARGSPTVDDVALDARAGAGAARPRRRGVGAAGEPRHDRPLRVLGRRHRAPRLRHAHRRLPPRGRARLGRHALPPARRDVHRGAGAPVAAASTTCGSSWRRPRRKRTCWDAPLAGPVAVVVGSERHGVSAPWLAAADELVSIPMPGPADSLNVAVAAGSCSSRPCGSAAADSA